VLSLGAVAVATYVFTVAARNYVSDSSDDEYLSVDNDGSREQVSRSPEDRRQPNNVIYFPIQLSSGDVVYRDRRIDERRSTG